MDESKLVVVALGGHAINRPDGSQEIPDQFAQTAQTANVLVDLVSAGHRLVITHGNGPQVGHALRRVELSRKQVYELPLEICVADTQGGIGYMIVQCLTNELSARGLTRPVACLVTTVLVDAEDPAFAKPTKPIGAFLAKNTADEHVAKDGWDVVQVSKHRYRRVVASPVPRRIFETASIRQLVDADHIVIACGGGGVPVIRDGQGTFRGVAAVVDKDRVSALLATEISANELVIVTAVPQVYVNYGKPDQQPISQMTVHEARIYLGGGHFAVGSMGPKIEAAVCFLEQSCHRDAEVLVTSPESLNAALAGGGGTRIVRER